MKSREKLALRATVMVLAVAAVAFLVSFPVIHNGFVDYDDPLYIKDAVVSQGLTTEGISLAFTSVDRLYWHPLTWLSHELDFEWFGSAVSGHHFTSILLHTLTAGLLCLLCLQLGAGVYQAGAASLLWALHPLRAESFAWLAERKDVLCALFFVAAVTTYLRYAERPSRARYATWLGWFLESRALVPRCGRIGHWRLCSTEQYVVRRHCYWRGHAGRQRGWGNLNKQIPGDTDH